MVSRVAYFIQEAIFINGNYTEAHSFIFQTCSAPCAVDIQFDVARQVKVDHLAHVVLV